MMGTNAPDAHSDEIGSPVRRERRTVAQFHSTAALSLLLVSAFAVSSLIPVVGAAAAKRHEERILTDTITIGSRTLAFSKTGHGPAVVIVHGIGGHKEDWTATAAALAPSHTVYAVDMLGFGASSKTGDVITIGDQVDAIVALLDSEKVERTDVIGNSVGGWVAATLAADHPTRVGKLILVDAAGFKAMFEGPPPVDFYPTDAASTAKLLHYVRFDPTTHTPTFVDAAVRASAATGDARAAAAVGKGMFASPRLEDVADRVTAPTLVIWGAEDRLFPPAVADLIAGHIRGARKSLIPAASHFPQLDNPAAFDAAVSAFLAG